MQRVEKEVNPCFFFFRLLRKVVVVVTIPGAI